MTPDGPRIAAIESLLACPECRDPLSVGPDWIRCESCDARYPIDDGVALLALRGGSETWGVAQDALQGTEYQAEFQDIAQAAEYNLQFRRRPLKLGVTPRESRLIRRCIRQVGRSHAILEIPCGGGRLTPAFADATDLVIEADIAIGQVLYGRKASQATVPRVWMTASAFHIPLRDRSVDGVICVRLSHHLPTAAERERLFAEVMRVSSRFAIVTYFDRHSLKHLTWRLRHPFSRKARKPALSKSEVASLAEANGARLVSNEPLSRFGSGHRYALLVRDPGSSPARG
ncbi:MAG: methyltransferase domain-containing protein [Gammaproteobacteria bacterium]|nr:methyltransferase domain-containing protein [Gammaproteobacteria bacterium]